MGKKRLRVEALLAAATSPLPPPAGDLIPDATLADDLVPEDLPRLLGLLGRADLYLQDEVEVALHPTLTRVWSRAGRSRQRLVQAPGTNAKRYGFGLVDWRDGHLDFELAEGRRAVPLCAQLRRAVALAVAWAGGHGDLRQPWHPHAPRLAAAAGAAGRAGRGAGAGLHPDL